MTALEASSEPREFEGPTELSLDVAEIERRCSQDLDFFASICLPDIVQYEFPPFYKTVWALLIQVLYVLRFPSHPIPEAIVKLGLRRVFRFALGIPRGHAKTTFIKLLVCFSILYDLIDFALIVCSTEPLGVNFLSDVNDILSSRNIRAIYGSWHENLRKDSLALKRGSFNGKDKIIAAIGANTSIRGLNLGSLRPDMILMDDTQSKDNAESEIEQKRLLEHIIGTIMKLRNMRKCLIAYVGNMYSDTCILYQFKKSPAWHSLITGGILADGTALWEELIPLEALLDDYHNDASVGLAHIWFAEIQNDPIGARRRLLPDGQLPAPIEYQESEVLGAFLTIDPAGRKKKSDANVITVHLLLTDSRLVIPEIRVIQGLQADPETVIKTAIDMAVQYRCSAIFPEGVAYQETLAFWLEFYLDSYNLTGHIMVEAINPGNVSKATRISGYFASMLNGLNSVIGVSARNLVTFQALSYNFDRTDNADDILDCCAMGELIRSSKLHLVQLRPESTVLSVVGVQVRNTPIDSYHRRSSSPTKYRWH